LPLPSEGLVQDYTSGFREGMRIRAKLSEAYDISPASYDAELGAYTVRFKTRAASLANQLLGQPDTSTIWAQVRQAGVAPGELRCVFKGLLAGRNAADAAQLRANIGDTTQRCGWSASRLEQYISETPTLFSPVVSAMTSIAFFTKAASIQIIVAAPVSRVADVQATAELIRSTAQLPANIQLKTSLLHDLEDWSPVVVGRLIGALFGPVFVVVIVGGAFSLLLVKLGTRGSIAFPAVCAVLLLLVALGSLRAPTLSVFTLIQYGSYLSTMLLTLRPITRWSSTRAAKAAP
jgi:hypothetical protein